MQRGGLVDVHLPAVTRFEVKLEILLLSQPITVALTQPARNLPRQDQMSQAGTMKLVS